jgi:hypothetical protein
MEYREFIEVDIGEGLKDLKRVWHYGFERAQDRVSRMFRDSYKSAVRNVGAVDQGYFVESIDIVEQARTTGELRTVFVESDHYLDPVVAAARGDGIGDIIELGRRDINYPGRYPARQAVEFVEDSVELILEQAVMDGKIKIERG